MVFTRFLQLVIVTSVSAALRLSCDHAEESKSYNFTCDLTQSYVTQFTWRQGTCIIARCVLGACTNVQACPGSYTASVNNKTSILTISNITLSSQGLYSCSAMPDESATCDLIVYARPKNVSCQQPEYQSATGNVTIKCTAKKMYPIPVCQFSWFKNGTMMNVPQNIDYQNMSMQGQPGYYNPTCILSLPTQVMEIGLHVFSVMVYPNVTGNATNDIMYGTKSNLTSPVNIIYPTIKLECADTYSRENYSLENTTISCACRETANTFLSANTSISQGSIGQSSGTGYTTYNFLVNRYTGEITCQASLLSWTSTPGKYRPQVAYGPNSVSVKVMYNLAETSLIDLCGQTQPVVVTVNCTTSAAGARPGVVYEFIINGTLISTNPVTSSSLTYTVTKGGPLSVQCIGANSVFTQVSVTSHSLVLQVTEPPTAPPIIDKYKESGSLTAVTANPLTVKEGNNMIRCRVDGGYPSVSSLSVACGTQTYTSGGNVVYVGVNVDRYMDASECSCTATHSSSCYRNNQTVTKLDVLCKYQLENSNIENMVHKVRVNNAIEISIPVYGYPEPTLHLDSDTILDTKTYSLTYTNLRPSYGVVSLQIDTVTEVVFQSYRLSISNSEGSLVYNFQIIEEAHVSEDPTNVGAIVGGIVAGILVIVAVVLVVVYVKRKGLLTRGVRNKNTDTNMNIMSPGEQKGPHYQNFLLEQTKYDDPQHSPYEEVTDGPPHSSYEEVTDGPLRSPYEEVTDGPPRSPYEEITDIPPHTTYVELNDVPPQSPYEEIRNVPSNPPSEEISNALSRPQYENSTDFLSDRPVSFSDNTDIGFSHSHRGEVEYENTLSDL